MSSNQVVFVVDDDVDFRESLIWLLEGAGYHCRGYGSAEAFLGVYNNEPGCLLLDIRMPGMSGMALQRQLQDTGSPLSVILITGHGSVAWAVEAMKNNAVDFIEKPFDDEALLRLVADTLVLSDKHYEASIRQQDMNAFWSTLSKREKQVAELVVTGKSNKQIGEALGITIKTVEVHRSRAMKKMQSANLAEFIERFGLIK